MQQKKKKKKKKRFQFNALKCKTGQNHLDFNSDSGQCIKMICTFLFLPTEIQFCVSKSSQLNSKAIFKPSKFAFETILVKWSDQLKMIFDLIPIQTSKHQNAKMDKIIQSSILIPMYQNNTIL